VILADQSIRLWSLGSQSCDRSHPMRVEGVQSTLRRDAEVTADREQGATARLGHASAEFKIVKNTSRYGSSMSVK
jgi:hypothetical protein